MSTLDSIEEEEEEEEEPQQLSLIKQSSYEDIPYRTLNELKYYKHKRDPKKERVFLKDKYMDIIEK